MSQFSKNTILLSTIMLTTAVVPGLHDDFTDNGEIEHKREIYEPNWKSLDTRPLPEWYDRAKIGIFVHWGVFSVPSVHSEWFWINWKSKEKDLVNFMKKNYPPDFTYQEFAIQFKAEFFDAKQWVDLFEQSGAKYVVITAKHHEGFTMFPSKQSFSWNSMDIGPKRDVVGELAEALRSKNLTMGVYYSLCEWFNPLYRQDMRNLFSTHEFMTRKVWPDLVQLIEDYRPLVLWSDGDWDAFDTYWNSTGFLSWLYNYSPVSDNIVVNDRWGIGIPCRHGDFYNCRDKFNPGVIQSHKYENAFSVDKKSWGYRRNLQLSQVMSDDDILYQVVSTVSCGGNVLINVGPSKEGTIAPIFQERLLSLGKWLSLNGEAIYGTSPWHIQNDTVSNNVWYTCLKEGYDGHSPTGRPTKDSTLKAVYAIVLEWPKNNELAILDITDFINVATIRVSLLESGRPLQWGIKKDKTVIYLPDYSKMKSKLGWVVKFTSTNFV